jgi:imidazolonepropionase
VSKTTLITGLKGIYGITDVNQKLKKGNEMAVLNGIEGPCYLLVKDKKIHSFGPVGEAPETAERVIQADGQYLLPGWCDSHTHIVFATSREAEYLMRLRGKSYQEIAAAGGGILNSTAKLRNTDESELYDSASERLEEIMNMGTTAVEIKSGYGLSTASELKMLRVIRQLKENYPITIKSSFLGAHAIPIEYKNKREEYIRILLEEMLPKIYDEQLADYCDVFCDTGFFTVEETDRILKAAAKYGLKAKIHANELANSGGVQVGIANDAISVDHLEMIEDEEIEALLKSNTIPTVLPSVSYFLGIRYAPARTMIDRGLGVCIATDYNPGSSPSGNIAFLLSLACNRMKLLPEEAINAVTINGACALELEASHGSIAVGKKANLILTKKIPSLEYIPYAFGSNHIDKVMIDGKWV